MIKTNPLLKIFYFLGITSVIVNPELQASNSSIHTGSFSHLGKGSLTAPLPFKAQQLDERASKYPFFVWSSVDRADFKDKFFISQQKGHSYTETLGVDYRYTSRLKLGAFIAHSDTYSTTPINSGKYHSFTNGVRPYVIYYFMPWLSLNILGGYSGGSIKTREISRVDSSLISSKNRVKLWVASSSLNAILSKNDITSALRIGYVYNQLKENQYVVSNGNRVDPNSTQRNNINSLAQFSYNWHLGHSMIKTFTPYIHSGVVYYIH
ncbi:MAG: autotransporter domain-containing protein, partial [Alphaproteobacteria bacterium]|nr:autotransporter domain-containing protein [Alphaproteobacteria bacterium]